MANKNLTLRVNGDVDVAGMLDQLSSLANNGGKKAVRKAATKGGQKAAKTAKSLCPVRDTKAAIKSAKKFGGFGRNSLLQGSDSSGGKKKSTNYRGGLLKKSLGYKVKSYPASGTTVAIMGPRDGFRKQVGVIVTGKKRGQPVFADPRKYAHLVIRGTRHSHVNDFMTPAAYEGRDAMAMELAVQTDAMISEALKT